MLTERFVDAINVRNNLKENQQNFNSSIGGVSSQTKLNQRKMSRDEENRKRK
jgi:hypothetical protein